MSSTLFLAGATGAIGSRLTPMLLGRGHRVFGLTRADNKTAKLWAQGAVPIVGDVFDTPRLTQMLRATRPDAVVHMLTDLPPMMEPSKMPEAIVRNARIRAAGTASLITAARAADVSFMVAQSIAWAYAPNDPPPHTEDAPLDLHAEGSRAVTISGVVALEQAVMNTPGLTGTVLRFGQLYGPGTHSETAAGKTLPLHVDAAAWSVVLAVDAKRSGIYNIVAPNAEVTVDKAQRELGWDHSRWSAGAI